MTLYSISYYLAEMLGENLEKALLLEIWKLLAQ
jgi:hypothetical protein